MLPYLRWIFTTWFMVLSVGVMLAALLLVATHFETFRDRLPASQEFFRFRRWFTCGWPGVVKVIHEFGHGLSCKAFGGEVHEMGVLFLCLSPCLYCNVSDAWTLPRQVAAHPHQLRRHLRGADHRRPGHLRLVEHRRPSRSSTTCA